MARFELLEEMLGPQLDVMERILQHGKAGKYADKPIRRDPDHHFTKADSHMVRAGALYDCTDDGEDGTGEAHVLLAAVRLMMVDHANRLIEEAADRGSRHE